MEKKYGVLLENGTKYLTKEEYFDLYQQLRNYGMELTSFESGGVKASLNDICIFVSQNVTELLVASLMIPAAYDALKAVICFSAKKIKERVKIVQPDKVRDVQPSIRFKMDDCEIIAPIPSDLPAEQFGIYFDAINEAIKTIQCNPSKKCEHFIVEAVGEDFQVKVKTIIQYAQEQMENRQKDEGK